MKHWTKHGPIWGDWDIKISRMALSLQIHRTGR